MGQYEHQRYAQFQNPVRDAPEDGFVEHLSRGAHGQQVSQPLVEDQFGRDARVDAAQYDRERVLALDEAAAQRAGLVRMLLLPGPPAPAVVAGRQPAQCLFGRGDGHGAFGVPCGGGGGSGRTERQARAGSGGGAGDGGAQQGPSTAR